MWRVLTHVVRVLVTVVIAANLSHAQVTPAPQPPTLFSFLGVPQGIQKIRGALTNRRGNRPRREPKPALKALADQANLESPVEAIKKAAEIKAAEDLKPQKIKAIKYLTQIGCGCYDKDGSITEALIAASDDCTPDVRLAVVEAIEKAAKGTCCSRCGETCCCNEKMAMRLAEMAYMRDETGCYLEPNSEVRQGAIRALQVCCPDSSPVMEVLEDADEPSSDYEGEGPEEEVYQGEGGEADSSDDEVGTGEEPPANPRQPRPLPAPAQTRAETSRDSATWDGVLWHVDAERGIAHVHLEDRKKTIPIGSDFRAYGLVDGRETHIGTLRVYETFEGSVNVRAVDAESKQSLVKGVAVRQQLAKDAVVAQTPRPTQYLAPVSPQPTAKLPTSSTANPGPRADSPLGRLKGLLRDVSHH